jgi:hypothetical protein
MTNIEKIKQARAEMEAAFEAMRDCGDSMGFAGAFELNLESLRQKVSALVWLQAESIVQATEVADENFARAQKLSEQVQENVRHIERLAGERGEVFTALVDALTGMMKCFDDGVGVEWNEKELAAARAALALAKGEAV